MENSERYTRGWSKLQEIDGEAGEHVIDNLNGISPELAQYIIEYSFGDVYCQPRLDNKQKEVTAVASLVAQAAIPQLKVHLNGALNTGCTVTQVRELILQMSVYAGFPRCINAMNALKEYWPKDAARAFTTPKAKWRTSKQPPRIVTPKERGNCRA